MRIFAFNHNDIRFYFKEKVMSRFIIAIGAGLAYLGLAMAPLPALAGDDPNILINTFLRIPRVGREVDH